MNELVGPQKAIVLVVDDVLANREMVQAYRIGESCAARMAARRAGDHPAECDLSVIEEGVDRMLCRT